MRSRIRYLVVSRVQMQLLAWNLRVFYKKRRIKANPLQQRLAIWVERSQLAISLVGMLWRRKWIVNCRITSPGSTFAYNFDNKKK